MKDTLANLPMALLPAKNEARRNSSDARAFALSAEETQEFLWRHKGVVDAVHRIENVIDWLSVETSPRYQPTAYQTFCNIYACDACHLLGVYLPRVWWTGDALRALNRGRTVNAELGSSVVEMSSNRIFEWLEEYGSLFGWHEVADTFAAQATANKGELGLACGKAKAPNEHGHIAIIIPERSDMSARRVNDTLLLPVQSQAGRANTQAGVLPAWWSCHSEYAFWAAAPQTDIAQPPTLGGPRKSFANGILELCAKLLLGPLLRQVDAKLIGLVAARDSSALSQMFVHALIAAEDRRFCTHGGFDMLAISRAILRRLGGGSIQGASTIEQQLVRTLTNRRAPTIWRKLTEIMLAAHVARRFPKAEIASAYLRTGYYGWRMNGVVQACRRLGIDPAACSLDQACEVIAALRYPLPEYPTDELVSIWRRRSVYIRHRLSRSWRQ